MGLIELEHRELGIVLGRDTLVTKIAVNLEDALDPADHQTLEIQLRRNPQKERHVQRVVVRGERPCQRAPGHGVHHRGFDLEKSAIDQEAPNTRQDARADLKHPPRRRIDDQINVSLPVSCLDVGQAVPFLRQRHKTLRQKLETPRPHGQLVGPRAEQPPLHADVVADVQPRRDREISFGERVFPHIQLQTRHPV